nr:helix-turn-helix transcriptional regulator [uncultured Treponema sp.]
MDSVFKKILRSELDFQDIRVKELSARTGISPRTLEGYLGARGSIPPADVAFKIAQALNVSVEYLVTGNALYNESAQKEIPKNTVEEKISFLPAEKKMLVSDFIGMLDRFEIRKKEKL